MWIKDKEILINVEKVGFIFVDEKELNVEINDSTLHLAFTSNKKCKQALEKIQKGINQGLDIVDVRGE